MFGGKSAAPKKRKAVWEESAETDRNLELSHGSGGGMKVLRPTNLRARFRFLVTILGPRLCYRNPLAGRKCCNISNELTPQVVVAISLNMT